MSKRVRPCSGFYKSILTNDFGVPLSSKYKPESKVVVLPETYEVERVVARRSRGKKREYFVKWKNYSSIENTWEPEEHLPEELITAFAQPDIDPVRIEECRERLALLLETSLKSKAMECNESLLMRHDVVRHLFPRISLDLQSQPHDISEQELIDAGLGPFLKMYVTVTGGGCSVSMPLQVKLFIAKSPSSRDENGKEKPSRPVEKVRVAFRKQYHAGTNIL